MKRLIIVTLAVLLLPSWANADHPHLASADVTTVNGVSQLPYEINIGNACSYNYDHMTRVVERVFARSGINPSWESEVLLANNNLYLSINVECVTVTERNKSYTTSIKFSQYDDESRTQTAEYGKDGYGSNRLFNQRLSESVEEALNHYQNGASIKAAS